LRLAAAGFLRALLLPLDLFAPATFLAGFGLVATWRDGRLVFVVGAVRALPVFVAISLISLIFVFTFPLRCVGSLRRYFWH
jgi:hypothetical protein